MDRNGKRPKARRGDDALNAERSDTKARAREALGGLHAGARVSAGQGTTDAHGAPGTPGRKGRRG
jgi:hypothetical protein